MIVINSFSTTLTKSAASPSIFDWGGGGVVKLPSPIKVVGFLPFFERVPNLNQHFNDNRAQQCGGPTPPPDLRGAEARNHATPATPGGDAPGSNANISDIILPIITPIITDTNLPDQSIFKKKEVKGY